MTKRVNDLKLALCQMKVIPGRPDLNTAYILGQIEAAAGRGVDIIVFPELAVTGYFIGDLFEDEAFLSDAKNLNQRIRQATESGICAIVGTTILYPRSTGEDGRVRLSNAAVVYANGRYVGHAVKTLQPNYRIFDDDRHFFSARKLAFDRDLNPEDTLDPIEVKLKNGRVIKLGVMLCEDMWHEDYPLNPGKILTEKGAEILINLSASPWTWQKNRKRHQIVKNLIETCKVPFVYVNNTGVQNTGKNIVIFDGSSTLYNAQGESVFEIKPYTDGTFDCVLQDDLPVLVANSGDDSKELYEALRCGIQEFFTNLPPNQRKVLIGLSGGIDSALAAALYVDALGKDNVIGINMPSKFSSDKHQNLARLLANNLGIAYEIHPIQEIVDKVVEATSVAEGTLAYENIQARVRMEILAARAQMLGCMFSANWNKVEAAFGYGTLYADMAGALAVEGDLIKREVYQVADYLNRIIFDRPVIPEECFTIAPTAELRSNQKDPFDYGNLERRGYHDEMVRAFVEFRRNPEWFLELFLADKLEIELMLASGHLKTLFPNPRYFIHDLEKRWRSFHSSYFKRIQGPPILIVSRRAFGTDLRESMLSAHFTRRYFELRSRILAQMPARIAVYGTGANPPCRHHRQIVQELLAWFYQVIVVPSGNRPDKKLLRETSLDDRRAMTLMNFKNLDGAIIDCFDLDNNTFTPTFVLDERMKKQYPDFEIWHVVGADLITGGRNNQAEIQRVWKKGSEIWQKLNFAVIRRAGFEVLAEDLPPLSELVEIDYWPGSSTQVRERLARSEDVSMFLITDVEQYINDRGLYGNE